MKWSFITILLLITLISTTGSSNMDYPESDHFDGKQFHNLGKARTDKGFFALMKWMIGEKGKEWPKWVDDNVKPEISEALKNRDVRITTINHATHLIQVKDLTILTDPVYSQRASPFTWVGPERRRAPGISFEELPHVDIVIISHNHYDHMDLDTIAKLTKKSNPLFIVPLGNKKILASVGTTHVIELDWWQKHEVPAGNIYLTPAQHWSNRGLTDRNLALWGSFVLEMSESKIYFAGDTGYGVHFKLIEEKFGPMDIAILPIGAYEPRWFMKEQHINPAEAVQAHQDLKSKLSIGTHFGTFHLTNEGIEEPITDLKKALEEKKLAQEAFVAPKNGQTILYKKD
jgi:L-ascorbate metabolism protein UlaG (beta-lactamase superfamily)